MTDTEIEERARYYASQFMGQELSESFRAYSHKEDDLTLVNLPKNTKMRIYRNSNTVTIEQKISPQEYTFRKNLDERQLAEMALNTMKKLELHKYRLPIEQIGFETLWQIKKGGVTREKKELPIILCRIVGAFRRHINKIPVCGGASIFIKIATEGLVESVGIDWREINQKPIAEEKIIEPSIGVEKILNDLNSILPNMDVTEYVEPQFFSLGYFSLPKRQQQKYMQPVYIAGFNDVGFTTWEHLIVVPATSHVYEPFKRALEEPKSSNKFKA
ncbi:MAG: hypothetical protein ACRD80_07725 [Nitrososphaeraceae archaeon]